MRNLCAAVIALTAAASPAALAAPPVEAVPDEIVVRANPGATEAELRALAAAAQCEYDKPVPNCPNFYVFRLRTAGAGNEARLTKPQPPSAELLNAITQLEKTPGVQADPNYILRKTLKRSPLVPMARQGQTPKGKGRATEPPSTMVTPDDPLYPKQKGLDLIRMPEAWAIQAGIRPVVVGVADTGIDIGHPDFNDAAGVTRVIGGANFVADANGAVDPNAYQDGDGHGTHVAGTVGATTGNALGVASVAGWARGGVNVRLRIARVLGNDGSGTTVGVYSGIGSLVDLNVDVINLSLGGYSNSQIETDTIARGIGNNIIIVAGAGNDNLDTGLTPFFPAELAGVIKVTATNINTPPTRAGYSNFGGAVTIAAPGGDIRTSPDEGIYSTWPRGIGSSIGIVGYESVNGTSMASPHVAGVVALLLANGASRDVTGIRQLIQETALPLDETPNFSGGNKYGAGLIDAYSALLQVSDPPFTLGFADNIVDAGASYDFDVDPFKIAVRGVANKPAPGTVTIEIQTATFPSTTIRVIANDVPGGFTIPTLPTGVPKATVFLTDAPTGNAPIRLAPGRYKAIVKVNGVETGEVKFFTIAARDQPVGRTLFALPFKVRQPDNSTVPPTEPPAAPESAIFGSLANFTLARYNPLRLPSDFDYAFFQSAPNGRRDGAASFSATAPDGSPLTFELNNPAVNIAPVGLGYWLNLDQQVRINPIGETVVTPVAIRLFASGGGWNMIGAPFTGAAGWGTCTVIYNGQTLSLEEAIRRGIISSALIGYVQGDYQYNVYPNGTLEPFNGYWVRAYQDCTLVVAPASSNRGLSRAASGASRAALPRVNGWRARLVATVAGDRDGQNYFGQAKGATNEADGYDIPKPPSGGGHAYLRFLTGGGSGGDSRSTSNAFDMRALGEGKGEWTAAVSTDKPKADVTLSWDGMGGVPNRASLTLTDTATNQTVDMRSRSSYTFRAGDAGSQRIFKIAMAPGRTAGPLTISNVSVVPAGTRSADPGLSIRFNTNQDAEITGTVKALNGRVLGSLVGTTRSKASETMTLRWNGRAQNGAAVPPGAYLIEIRARAANGTVTTFKQPIQSIR